jgi:hypothetical protein
MSESKMDALDALDFPDDDKHTITVTGSGAGTVTSPGAAGAMRGMGLNLSFAAADSKSEAYPPAMGIQEESVTVVFDLPDGSQGESSFKLGQTVEVLKSFVESEFGIPMLDQHLYIGGDKIMHNPFSLLDFPEAKGVEEIYVRVAGHLPAEAKK